MCGVSIVGKLARPARLDSRKPLRQILYPVLEHYFLTTFTGNPVRNWFQEN